MKSTKKRPLIYRLYVASGICAVAFMSFLVIFAVIMRYCFNISFSFLEEFTTVMFAFTTFWGAGICILENENINIDILYVKLTGWRKTLVDYLNAGLVLMMNAVMLRYSVYWVQQVGSHASMGMKIPMMYIYGIMPVCMIIAIICSVLYIVGIVRHHKDKPDQAGLQEGLPEE